MIRAGLSFNFTYRLLSLIYDRLDPACFLQHPNTSRHHATSQFQSLGSARLRLVPKGCQIDRHLPSASRASCTTSSSQWLTIFRHEGCGDLCCLRRFVQRPSLPDWRLLLPQRLRCLVAIFIVNYTFSSIPIVSSYSYPQSQTQLFCIMNAVMM